MASHEHGVLLMDITKINSVDDRIQNALDPSRELSFERIDSNRIKVKTKDKNKHETREYFIKCDSYGNPIKCTCLADEHYNDCRHKDAIQIIRNEIEVPKQVDQYRTNGVEDMLDSDL